MSLLAPLGLMGLIGLGILILIYIIKPNYQQKIISSTYVWKLSLKYTRKNIPVSKLNNILIFICQFLILAICGFLLANPVIPYERVEHKDEKIVIIDASASMRVSDGTYTRFQRAVRQAKALVDEAISNGGIVSVILADESSDFVVQQGNVSNKNEILVALDELLVENTQCSYGSADVTGAVALSEEILLENSEAEVVFFTATEYIEKNGITVVDVSDESEWNVAIMGCTAELDENNTYEISVDVGCYSNEPQAVRVICDVYGANNDGSDLSARSMVEYFTIAENRKTITFISDDFDKEIPLYAFDYLQVRVVSAESTETQEVAVGDSFDQDNFYFVYGGKKDEIKIQYASSVPNTFFAGAIRTMRESMKLNWNIQFTELGADETASSEGFDFYIYEHRMPDVLPTDGIVLLVDPDFEPEDSGIILGGTVSVDSSSTLASGITHDVTRFINANNITIAKYTKLNHDGTYDELMYYEGDPVMLLKDTPESKVVVWAFDLHYSNFSVTLDFPIMMYNMFNYFFPKTFASYAYTVGEGVDFQPRGTELTVNVPSVDALSGVELTEKELEKGHKLAIPGTYTVSQKGMRENEYIIENFFVQIPNFESDIAKTVDALPELEIIQTIEKGFDDLLLYFAIGLVSLLFFEWWLHSREHM